MLKIIDTHCHIHEDDYPEAEEIIKLGKKSGVTKFICVGTDLESSKKAVAFAKNYKKDGAFASIGIHPHEATSDKLENNLSKNTWDEMRKLASEPEVIAIGEFGFDFFYHKEKKA